MSVAVGILGVLVAVLLLFLVSLLRSHAEILRRLAALESGLDAGALRGGGSAVGGERAPIDRGQAGAAAADIGGQTLAGDGVKLSLGPGAPDTLLAFMGTGCHACAPLWEGLRGEAPPTPAGARLVVVTKGPERERLARLLELAPDGLELVMSSQAWSDFGVPSTPHFVLVRGGEIAGRGSATSWQQIMAFLSDADDDDRLQRVRALGTEARAARAERALSGAGIGPDHPSLYPSRITPPDGAPRVDRMPAGGANATGPQHDD